MTKPVECPACERVAALETPYEAELTYKGADLHVAGLLQMSCSECGFAFETHDQHDSNVALVKKTFLAQREEYKKAHGLLTGAEIRKIRKELGLNQQPAAQLFGGGLNAFSKYENEEIVQSTSMDRLLRLVSALGRPGAELLALLANGEAIQNVGLTSAQHYWFAASTVIAQQLFVAKADKYKVGLIETTGAILKDILEHPAEPAWATTTSANSVTLVGDKKHQHFRRNPVTGAYFLAEGR